MLALDFFRWWYGRGWSLSLHDMRDRLRRLSEAYSVPILLRTLLAPWRRIITFPGAGMGAHLQALVDNTISRLVGFVVRVSVLAWVSVLMIMFLLVGLVLLVIWPLLPLAAVGLIVKGLL
jgi:hypothetical protein